MAQAFMSRVLRDTKTVKFKIVSAKDVNCMNPSIKQISFSIISIFLLNLVSVYLFIFWYLLYYFLLEGKVPAFLLIISFIIVVSIPVLTNILFLFRSGFRKRISFLVSAISLMIIIFDPLILKLYNAPIG